MSNPFIDINQAKEKERKDKELAKRRLIEEKSRPLEELHKKGMEQFVIFDKIVKDNLQLLREANYAEGNTWRKSGEKVSGYKFAFNYKDDMKVSDIDLGYWCYEYPFVNSKGYNDTVTYFSVSLKYDDNGSLFFKCVNHKKSGGWFNRPENLVINCGLSENELLNCLKELYSAGD